MKSKNRTQPPGWGKRTARLVQMAGLLVSGLLLGAAQAPAQAQVVYNPANGHYYETVVPNVLLSWTDDKIAAQNRTYMGLRGHLAP